MADSTLTAERVRELLEYDPETGIITRRVLAGSRGLVGAIAGATMKNGYRNIGIDGTRYL